MPIEMPRTAVDVAGGGTRGAKVVIDFWWSEH